MHQPTLCPTRRSVLQAALGLAASSCAKQVSVADLCDEGLTQCGEACVDTQSDVDHCGGCGNACPEDAGCAAGTCVAICEDGLKSCDGLCVDVLTDGNNCGHCGFACPDSAPCTEGVCLGPCPEGLLACDSIGFHTERWRGAFVECCEALLGRGAEAARRSHANPIAVDAGSFARLAEGDGVRERKEALARDRPEILVLRVDRTDPSKNAVRGFEAFGLLLERDPSLHGRVGLLALLDPSRQAIPEYAEYRAATEQAAADVNARFGRPGWVPIRPDVRDDFLASVAAYTEYDVLLVNPVMDGLNLVAKEAPLVNGRDGALVLSRQAGAYDEIGEWTIGVDPLDVAGQADALAQAIALPVAERRRSLRAIRAAVRAHDLDAWAERELAELDERAPTRVA